MIVDSRQPPRRGSIFWMNLDDLNVSDHEQTGRRPIVVMSSQIYNAMNGLCIACPVTNSVKGYPFEVIIPPGACSIKGAILADQVRTLDWRERKIVFQQDVVPAEIMDHVAAKLSLIIEE